MLRRILGGVALAAVFTTGAHAQFTTTFTLQPVTGFNEYNGLQQVNSIPLGSWDGFTASVLSVPAFQVFCVDEAHDAFPGTPAGSYNAWVSSLTGNLADTRLGSGSVTQHTYNTSGVQVGSTSVTSEQAYGEAAYLASVMAANSSINQNDELPANSKTVAIQYAIWELTGNTFNAGDEPGYSSLLGTSATAGTVAFYEAQAAANWAAFVASPSNHIFIFTDVAGSSQEFIGNVNLPLSVPTPEPGTMAMLATGLVGLAGAGFRRRRNK